MVYRVVHLDLSDPSEHTTHLPGWSTASVDSGLVEGSIVFIALLSITQAMDFNLLQENVWTSEWLPI